MTTTHKSPTKANALKSVPRVSYIMKKKTTSVDFADAVPPAIACSYPFKKTVSMTFIQAFVLNTPLCGQTNKTCSSAVRATRRSWQCGARTTTREGGREKKREQHRHCKTKRQHFSMCASHPCASTILLVSVPYPFLSGWSLKGTQRMRKLPRQVATSGKATVKATERERNATLPAV